MKPSKQTANAISLREAATLNLRAFKLLWAQCPQTFISAAVSTTASALTPYVGIYLSAQIINELAGTRDPRRLTQWVLYALVSAAILSLLNTVLSRWHNYWRSTQYYQQLRIYSDKFFKMDFNAIDDPQTHELYSQVEQNDRWNSWGLSRLHGEFIYLINALMRIVGAAALTVSLFTRRVPDSAGWITVLNHPLFVAVILAVMLAVTFLAPLLSNKADSYWAKRADEARMGNRVFSFYGFMGYSRHRALDIRIYRQDSLVRNGLARGNSFTPESNIAKDARGPMGLLNVMSAVVSNVFTGIVYVFVCLKAWGGAFGVGSVTQYIGAITSLSSGVSTFLSSMGTLNNNAAFLRTTFALLDIPDDMYKGSLTIEKRSDRKYEIAFQNVSFKYPSSEEYALRNVSLRFEVGQRLAIVGQNGSGKTTFIKLLCRLYDPTEGEILLNGIDIRKYNYDEYMSIFSVVFQDFKLLAFELGQNIATQVRYDDKKAGDCLTRAGFASRLKEMPKGLETYLYKNFAEDGVDISGGEAQKIALARALYKDAPFVILDEPTAALDPVAEFEVYSKMNEMVGGKTAVFISHRLSSCRFCEDIAVFHEGELIQRGNHDTLLLDENGKYRALWDAQAQYYQH